jgi:23S rRNA pseudouridine2605 synthase
MLLCWSVAVKRGASKGILTPATLLASRVFRASASLTTVSGEDAGQVVAKVIAGSGLCSRREAVRLILDGRVEVNGAVVKVCGTRVGVADMVTVDGKVIDVEPPTTVVVALHKPKEFVTTTHDPAGRRTVYDLLPQHWQQLRSVGRLDFMTEGLLLFTNNGALKRFLELPKNAIRREYCVRLHSGAYDSKPVTRAALDALASGITIEGHTYGPILASFQEPLADAWEGKRNCWVSVVLHEGQDYEML